MPRWLQVWLALYLCAVTFISLSFLMSTLTNRGESSFTIQDKVWLEENYPGGEYVSDHEYMVCFGSQRIYFNQRHDGPYTYGNQRCWTPPR